MKNKKALIREAKYCVIVPDAVGSRGDEAMITGCLHLLQGQRALIITPNEQLFCDGLVEKPHYFDALAATLEELPRLFDTKCELILLGADALDGSCGYDAAYYRLAAIKLAAEKGSNVTVFCSVRSDMEEEIAAAWRALPKGVRVFVRDDGSKENLFRATGVRAARFSDLFLATPLVGDKAEAVETKERLAALEQALLRAEGECRQLRDKENALKNEVARLKNSRSYRLGQRFSRVFRFFVPRESRRALVGKMLRKAICHPILFCRSLSLRRIRKFFGLMKKGEVEYIDNLAENVMGKSERSLMAIQKPVIVSVDLSKGKTAADYPILTLPHWGEPTVSIVIPVYNQFAYTYHCVEAILKHSGDVTYEIIVADDASTDLTTEIESILPGVRCVTTPKNLRFLRNCNHAAKYAVGKYVLFLNNDTQVQPDWLSPLVSLIESAPDIGMVGSKLIYPDGSLQEAGGILWRDGSAWNYGNGQNPALPEFNYVKETDYISGAAIMLPLAVWRECGGFDEAFAPAYCEDSDLAFAVRQKGYRVLYQPKSAVVHFEGVSNGTDTSSGLKKYQVENTVKFRKKWKNILDAHPENGEDVFHARDKSFGKKTLVMVDH